MIQIQLPDDVNEAVTDYQNETKFKRKMVHFNKQQAIIHIVREWMLLKQHGFTVELVQSEKKPGSN